MEKLKQSEFSNEHIIVSFDVVSLCTNVPEYETIQLMVDHIYSENNLNVAPSVEMFSKNWCLYLYKQIDGVTMGSPLGPTLASFFLGQLEEKILGQSLSASLKLYL